MLHMKFHYPGKEFSSKMLSSHEVKLCLIPWLLLLLGLSGKFEINKQNRTDSQIAMWEGTF